MLRLKDKVAIVTGGTRGIGNAVAEAFLREGATIVITGRRKETTEQAVMKIREKMPDARISGIWPNLGSLASVREAFREVVDTYGRIDILINNAGVSEATPFANYTEEIFDRVMNINVKGVFNAAKAATEYMLPQESGVILNTSSMASFGGTGSGIAYPTSTYAVNGFTVTLARELGPKGIRANAVAPGITETDMTRALPKEIMEPKIARIPLRRFGKPHEIAEAFVFLASDEATYITGEILRVDGLSSN